MNEDQRSERKAEDEAVKMMEEMMVMIGKKEGQKRWVLLDNLYLSLEKQMDISFVCSCNLSPGSPYPLPSVRESICSHSEHGVLLSGRSHLEVAT